MAIYGIFSYQPSNGLLTGYGFFFVLYSSFLLIMMWSDMEQQIIMNPQLALFAILGLCYQLLLQPDQLLLQLLTAIASGLILLLLAILTRGGIGGGDIKLLAALGLWLKPEAMERLSVTIKQAVDDTLSDKNNTQTPINPIDVDDFE